MDLPNSMNWRVATPLTDRIIRKAYDGLRRIVATPLLRSFGAKLNEVLSENVRAHVNDGDAGGEIVAQGASEEIARNPKSYTSQYLKPALSNRPKLCSRDGLGPGSADPHRRFKWRGKANSTGSSWFALP